MVALVGEVRGMRRPTQDTRLRRLIACIDVIPVMDRDDGMASPRMRPAA